jgi:hypothetical protein
MMKLETQREGERVARERSYSCKSIERVCEFEPTSNTPYQWLQPITQLAVRAVTPLELI